MKSHNLTAVGSALVAMGLIAMALCLFPGAEWHVVAIGAAVMAAVIYMVFRQCEWRSRTGAFILLAAGTLSLCGVIINVNYFTEAFGATAAHPYLQNFDAMRDWSWACHVVYGDPAEELIPAGMGYVTAALLWLFGRSVTIPIIFDSICYVLALLMTGSVAYRLTKDRLTATAAVLIAALMCYLFAHGTLLIKDAPVTMLMAILACCMIKVRETSRVTAADMAVAFPALALMAVLRLNFMPMVALGALVLSIGAGRRAVVRLCAFGLMAMCLHWVMNEWVFPKPIDAVRVLSAEKDAEIILHNQYTSFWDNLTGDYTALPFYIKLLWLPVAMGIQFFVPFPWNYSRDMVFGPVEAVAHFGYFWYVAGALVIYWIFACRRRCSPVMNLTVLWAVLMTAVTAYLSSGRVSRYCLPYLPLLLPAAAYVAVRCRRERALWVWLAIFVVAAGSLLGVCYYIQRSC